MAAAARWTATSIAIETWRTLAWRCVRVALRALHLD
jgi:hypothetical protein